MTDGHTDSQTHKQTDRHTHTRDTATVTHAAHEHELINPRPWSTLALGSYGRGERLLRDFCARACMFPRVRPKKRGGNCLLCLNASYAPAYHNIASMKRLCDGKRRHTARLVKVNSNCRPVSNHNQPYYIMVHLTNTN